MRIPYHIIFWLSLAIPMIGCLSCSDGGDDQEENSPCQRHDQPSVSRFRFQLAKHVCDSHQDLLAVEWMARLLIPVIAPGPTRSFGP